jgi:hypothetical protein
VVSFFHFNNNRSWPKKDSYTGPTDASGRYHGEGELLFATFPFTGDAYAGQFDHGVRHGAGTYIAKNGDVFTGTWKCGKRHGQGIHTFCGGRKEVSVYRQGVRLSDEQVEEERRARRDQLTPRSSRAHSSFLPTPREHGNDNAPPLEDIKMSVPQPPNNPLAQQT